MHSTIRPFRIQFLAALGGIALVLAACSSSGASTAPSVARSAAASAAGGPSPSRRHPVPSAPT